MRIYLDGVVYEADRERDVYNIIALVRGLTGPNWKVCRRVIADYVVGTY